MKGKVPNINAMSVNTSLFAGINIAPPISLLISCNTEGCLFVARGAICFG